MLCPDLTSRGLAFTLHCMRPHPFRVGARPEEDCHMTTAANEFDLRRSRREDVHRHYSRVISLALSALDDGSQSPPPSREFIEWILSALGFRAETWTRLTDEELVDFVGCAGRLNEEVTRGRILEKIRKQRHRLMEWQEKDGNPILIDHRTVFE